MNTETYLTDKQVANRYNTGRATPWRWCKVSDFPKPVRLSDGCTRWRLSDLEKWEEQREHVA